MKEEVRDTSRFLWFLSATGYNLSRTDEKRVIARICI
jgi:hypothetical protein